MSPSALERRNVATPWRARSSTATGARSPRRTDGHEDQLGALGLVLNAVVLWNTRFIHLAVNLLRAQGYPVLDADAARLSALGFAHINMLGRYSFPRQGRPSAAGAARPLLLWWRLTPCRPCVHRETYSDQASRSSPAAAYCFSSLAHIRVMAAMSSSSRGSMKYFFTDPSNVRLIVSAKCRPLLVKLMSDTRPSPWSALRWRCPASMRSWTSRDALVGLTLTSLPARARTD
ncbi:transposase [Catellatospora sp. NEAU-YM18]|nr:transposase [Catellatospora tritici]